MSPFRIKSNSKGPLYSLCVCACVCVCSATSHYLQPSDCSPPPNPQSLLFMEFSRQEYWSGLLFPTPGHHPNPGIEPVSFTSPVLACVFFTTAPSGEPTFSHFPSGNHLLAFPMTPLFICLYFFFLRFYLFIFYL